MVTMDRGDNGEVLIEFEKERFHVLMAIDWPGARLCQGTLQEPDLRFDE